MHLEILILNNIIFLIQISKFLKVLYMANVIITRVTKEQAFARHMSWYTRPRWERRVYFKKEAAEILNRTSNGGEERPLVLDILRNKGVLMVGADFPACCSAQAALSDKNGELSLSDSTIHSVEEAVKLAEKEGKPLADAAILLNFGFMGENHGKILVFSSRNAKRLTDGKELEPDSYYLIGPYDLTKTGKESALDVLVRTSEE